MVFLKVTISLENTMLTQPFLFSPVVESICLGFCQKTPASRKSKCHWSNFRLNLLNFRCEIEVNIPIIWWSLFDARKAVWIGVTSMTMNMLAGFQLLSNIFPFEIIMSHFDSNCKLSSSADDIAKNAMHTAHHCQTLLKYRCVLLQPKISIILFARAYLANHKILFLSCVGWHTWGAHCTTIAREPILISKKVPFLEETKREKVP